MRKGMLEELDAKLERIGKLEVEESGKVMKQCKWTDIYKEDLGPDVRPRKPMILGGEGQQWVGIVSSVSGRLPRSESTNGD